MSHKTLWRSLFGWLHPSRPATTKRHPESRPETPPPATADMRQLRTRRRERMFAVVREGMIHAGVLSSAYKFKVLTLDRQGDSFLVLLDIDKGAMDTSPASLDALEKALRTLAKDRLEADIQGIYWRTRTPSSSAPTTPTRSAKDRLHERFASSHAAPPPDFQPTQPMTRQEDISEFLPLSQTQHGKLE